MKKFLMLGLMALVLVGFGCTGSARDERWVLSFDLPEGWVMYAGGNSRFAADPSDEVNPQLADITLQSTTEAIRISDRAPKPEDPTTYGGQPIRSADYAYIVVQRLDERRRIDESAEDLGKGFWRVKECEEGEDCQLNGAYNYTYYLVQENAKYKFSIVTNGQSPDRAIEIIQSAKPVKIK